MIAITLILVEHFDNSVFMFFQVWHLRSLRVSPSSTVCLVSQPCSPCSSLRAPAWHSWPQLTSPSSPSHSHTVYSLASLPVTAENIVMLKNSVQNFYTLHVFFSVLSQTRSCPVFPSISIRDHGHQHHRTPGLQQAGQSCTFTGNSILKVDRFVYRYFSLYTSTVHICMAYWVV